MRRANQAVLVKEIARGRPEAVRADFALDAIRLPLFGPEPSWVPVVDQAGVLVGVLTDADVGRVHRRNGRELRSTTVGAAMSREFVTVGPEAPIVLFLALVATRRTAFAMVVDGGGRYLGSVWLVDALSRENRAEIPRQP